jgi:hypothetical protein
MTDPLARIEAMIETLGSRKARFWTPLDTSEGQVSNAEAPENCGFGRFGRFGHHGENPLGDDLIKNDEKAADDDAQTSRASRASSPIQGSVQSVESVQTRENVLLDQGVGFGHLEASGVQNRGTGVQNGGKPAVSGSGSGAWMRSDRLARGRRPPGRHGTASQLPPSRHGGS